MRARVKAAVYHVTHLCVTLFLKHIGTLRGLSSYFYFLASKSTVNACQSRAALNQTSTTAVPWYRGSTIALERQEWQHRQGRACR